ncbi:MAG: ATP-dependent protease ATPase subunit HslU [Pyrinomonadaceae bacterium]
MAIYLGGEKAAAKTNLDDLTPREIVAELDKYVVGQAAAKRAVAVALRNRIRRQKLPAEMAEDVLPKNILMIGSTGVGKTEIARRLARLANSPFIKIEASKFTEVGYVGRDVESMIRELADVAVDMAKQAAFEDVKPRAEQNVEERLLDILLPQASRYSDDSDLEEAEREQKYSRTREKLREQLKRGDLDERLIDIETQDRSTATIDFIGGQGMEEMGVNLRDMMGNMFPAKTVQKKLTVGEARRILTRDEQEALVDMDQITRSALDKAQNSGIIFLDELDKVAGRESGSGGPEVSREGVQRDLLPIVEGTNVNTKYGMLSTDHILFIAAGAFHVAKPSDLIPELQGRFPIRVELEPLTFEDLKRILTQPKNSLIKQYQALLGTEGITLTFTEDAIDRIAEMTEEINLNTENIGARRLHTLVEKLLEEISFLGSEIPNKEQVIDAAYVNERLGSLIEDRDLRQYVL